MSAGDNFDGMADLHNYLTCIYIRKEIPSKQEVVYTLQFPVKKWKC